MLSTKWKGGRRSSDPPLPVFDICRVKGGGGRTKDRGES
jgi:hypothetical protein